MKIKKLINELKNMYSDDITFVCQKINNVNGEYTIIYLKGNTDSNFIVNSITRPLSMNIPLSYIEKTSFVDMNTTILELAKGQLLFIDHMLNGIFLVNCQQIILRSLAEPDNEATLNGSRDGFIESIITNIALVRQKLFNKDLKFKHLVIGNDVKTDIAIAYIENLCDDKLISDLETKLNGVNLEGIYSAHYIVEMIKDSKYSFFNTLGKTQRPDLFCAKLLEGGAGIIVNGSPTTILAPYLFVENFKSPDDYYTNFFYGTFTRLLRYLAFIITIITPAFYISLLAFHHELIPSFLALNIVASSSSVPMGVVMETTSFIVLFEILREAGLRMPTKVGQALSIVGAIIIGQAAVEASIVSAPTIIVVSITALTGFMTPKINSLVILLRILCILLASFFGLYGLMVVTIMFLAKLFSLKSYNTNYSDKFFSLSFQQIKDSIIRAPYFKFNKNEKVKRGDE